MYIVTPSYFIWSIFQIKASTLLCLFFRCRSDPTASYCRPNITSAIVPVGFTIEYSCSAGYLLNGPIAISCKELGVWSSTPPTCEQILDIRFGLGSLIPKNFEARCPPLEPSRGVKIECIDPANLEIKSCSERHKPGVEARFSCESYYRPAGDLPVQYEKCGKDGQWSPGAFSQFACVPDCGISEAPKTPYITNGVATKRGQWPWHVGIYVWYNGKLKLATDACNPWCVLVIHLMFVASTCRRTKILMWRGPHHGIRHFDISPLRGAWWSH